MKIKTHHTYAESFNFFEKPSIICPKEDPLCQSRATQIFSIEDHEGNADKGEDDYCKSFVIHFILHIISTKSEHLF